MKGFKKLFKIVVAAACCLNCLMPMNVSATFDPCDVNHDGTVSLVDVVIINRFLGGISYYTNYNQLDANQSHTIDTSDSTCVLKSLLGQTYSACFIRRYGNGFQQVISMPSISSNPELDCSVQSTAPATVDYIKRSYVGNRYVDIPYSLTINTLSLNSRDIPSGLIDGTDNRIVSHGAENSGIVAIGNNSSEYLGNGQWGTGFVGTGFIVGDHEIATAAHCVHTGGSIRTDVRVKTYDTSGNPTGTELEVIEVHVPADYTTCCATNDYALITVKEDLSNYAHFDIGSCYSMTASEVGAIPIHETGQPDLVWNQTQNTFVHNLDDTLYTHNGSVYGSSNNEYFQYAVDSTTGQSGAPVYTITRETYNNQFYYTYTALAIAISTCQSNYNSGIRLTKYHKAFYCNNSHALHTSNS